MARDANELKYPESWKDTVEDLQKLPPPDGVNKAEWDAKIADGTYYANVKIYQDGRQVVEWYKRGVGGGPGQPDPVQARSQGILPTVKAEWDKEEGKPDPTIAAPPTQANIVTRNPDGSLATTPNPNYTPPTSSNDWRTEGTPDGQGNFDNSRPIMVRTVNGKRETRQPTAKELEDWNLAGQMTRNPGGKTDQQIKDEQTAAETKSRQDRIDQEARDVRNRPTVKIEDDGKGGVVAISTFPDGRVATAPVSGVTGKPQQITHDGVVYERGPDGTYKPAAGIPTAGVGLKNVDNFVPDYGQGDLGLSAWATKQRQKIGLPANQGGITQAEYDSAVKAAHDRASVEVANVSAMTTVQRQQYIDGENARNTAAGYAENDLTRDASVFGQIWKYADPNSSAIMGWAPSPERAAMLRQKYMDAAPKPPPLHPMFQGLAARAGASPAAVPPSGTDAASLEAQNQATMVASRGAFSAAQGAGGPPAAPAAQVSAAASSAPAPGPAAPAPGPAATGSYLPPSAQQAANAGPVPGQDGSVWQPPAPSAPNTSPIIQPGMNTMPPDPTMPGGVSMAPSGPISSWVLDAMGQQAPMPQAPVNEGPAGPMNPAIAGLAQPRFDPYATGARMVALGFSASAIQQALLELGHG